MEKIFTFVFIVFVIISLPFLLVYDFFEGLVLSYLFRKKLKQNKKHILFIYSNSPNWEEYLKKNVFPKIEDKTIFLNWSNRSEWENIKPIEAKVFEHWGGNYEFNPMAIIFTPYKKVKTIRFFKAFKQCKKGKTSLLEEQESKLYNYLNT